MFKVLKNIINNRKEIENIKLKMTILEDEIAVLKYKEHIKVLPESINKDNIVLELEYIYSILSRI